VRQLTPPPVFAVPHPHIYRSPCGCCLPGCRALLLCEGGTTAPLLQLLEGCDATDTSDAMQSILNAVEQTENSGVSCWVGPLMAAAAGWGP
jgi:hypothetical protein